MTAPRVVAVVVTYRPDVAALRRLLDAVLPQVAGLTMVHNGAHPPSPDVEVPADVAFDVVTLGSNLGIARAQNEGITRALAAGASHVLLFDQDSEPAPDMVAALLAGEARAGARGLTVAACGARYHDPRQDNPPPFIRIEGLRLRRQPCADPDDVVAVDYLVSSGCLIPAQALRAVGPMNEDLFIDYVDIEWGLRAAALGLHSFGVCAARMRHDLGDAPLRVLGRDRPVHSPLRHYYLFRNAVALYRRPDLPSNWKWVDGGRLLLKFVAYALYARPRLDHLRMMLRGMRDGLRGRLGRIDDAGH